jgi:hypothetical protein
LGLIEKGERSYHEICKRCKARIGGKLSGEFQRLRRSLTGGHGVVYCCRHFRESLLSIHFILKTDLSWVRFNARIEGIFEIQKSFCRLLHDQRLRCHSSLSGSAARSCTILPLQKMDAQDSRSACFLPSSFTSLQISP